MTGTPGARSRLPRRWSPIPMGPSCRHTQSFGSLASRQPRRFSFKSREPNLGQPQQTSGSICPASIPATRQSSIRHTGNSLEVGRSLRSVVIWDLNGWKQPGDTAPSTARTYAAVEGRTGIIGIPVDSFMRLTTALGKPGNPCGIRLCIPWGASDALIQYLAAQCKTLPAGTDLRVEYGNELWNSANAAQWAHLTAVGQAGPPWSATEKGDAITGACLESDRVWRVFETAYGAPVIKVLSAMQSWTGMR